MNENSTEIQLPTQTESSPKARVAEKLKQIEIEMSNPEDELNRMARIKAQDTTAETGPTDTSTK